MTTAESSSSRSVETIRVVQVSDTHVSRKRAYFVDNWDVFVDEMRRAPPNLIVHSEKQERGLTVRCAGDGIHH